MFGIFEEDLGFVGSGESFSSISISEFWLIIIVESKAWMPTSGLSTFVVNFCVGLKALLEFESDIEEFDVIEMTSSI